MDHVRTNRETARTVQIDHADNADGPGNQQSQVLCDAEPKGRQRTDPRRQDRRGEDNPLDAAFADSPRTHDEYGIASMAHHGFGHAAEHKTLHARAPMRAHGDQTRRGLSPQSR